MINVNIEGNIFRFVVFLKFTSIPFASRQPLLIVTLNTIKLIVIANASFPTHPQKEIRIVPKEDRNELIIGFCPSEMLENLSLEDRTYMMETGLKYLLNLFNQKHEASIWTELKDRGLVNSISSYFRHIYAELPANDAMSMEKIDEIVKVVFQFLKFAKRDGVQRWIHEEKNTIKEIAINNMEEEDPLSIVKAISYKMQYYNIEHVVDAAFFDREFRPELIEQLIEHLTPENMRITLISKAFEGQTDRKEKYYGICYSFEDIAQERVDKWTDVEFNENLKLHSPNQYIPTDFELVEREKKERQIPHLIKRDPLANVWFMQDNKFKTPRAFYGIYLRNEFFRSDPALQLLLSLYRYLVLESLKKDTRLAYKAGIDFSIRPAPSGLIIEVHGYSEKLHIVLGRIMDRLVKFEPSRERFDKCKKQMILNFKNECKEPLQDLLDECFFLLVLVDKYTAEEMLDCMDRVTFEELESFPRRFFSRMFIYLFVHGNVTRADAELAEKLVKNRLVDVYGTTGLPRSSFFLGRALKLENHSEYIYNHTSEEHHENIILNLFQVGIEYADETAIVYLLVRLLKQHFFNKLRTEEQLGYNVSMRVFRMFGVQNITFCIRSSYCVQYLDERIQQFIRWAADHLASLTDEEFATYQKSSRMAWSEPVRKQTSESFRLWSYITEDCLGFGRHKLVEKEIECISKKDVIACFKWHLIKNPRKLSIRITGTKKITESSFSSYLYGPLVGFSSYLYGPLSGLSTYLYGTLVGLSPYLFCSLAALFWVPLHKKDDLSGLAGRVCRIIIYLKIFLVVGLISKSFESNGKLCKSQNELSSVKPMVGLIIIMINYNQLMIMNLE